MKFTNNTTQDSSLALKEIKGCQVPSLGFGTFKLQGLTCLKAVLKALETGYRHIDTARAYGNEADVGRAIKESGVDRNEIFLTTKIWRDSLRKKDLQRQFEESLEMLEVDYLDLVLIHWPNPDIPLSETIGAFQELQEKDQLRYFGVSNFPPRLFKEAMEWGEVFCNQVEYHPFLAQGKLLKIARDNDILITAYSPLAQGEVIGHPDLEKIARKHGKSSEQVAIRWLIEQDHVAAIPRSSREEHIESNFNVFDFSLDEEDRAHIADLPKNRRQIDPEFAPDWEESGGR
jgi:2,5-diketo-D-gluconate reductase B